ncbi:MAG: NfeD family protein [Alphaproteobacteria bacterium]|nr:NfeD family protein [Alphaproteobacteria bacterium]
MIFLVVLAFSLFFTWSFLRNSFEKKDRFLNRPVTKLIGSEFILKDEVQDSHYRLDAQGTSWIVRVPLCSTKGDKVRIVGVDGVVLLAELVPAP